MCNHHSIFCVIPPHMLVEIMNRGNAEHASHALHTLINTERMRGHRQILNRYDLTGANNGKYRVVESAGNKEILAGTIIRKEGQALTGDQAVDEAYQFTGDVYDFYKQNYNRNSIDGNGLKLKSTVHYGSNFDNAFWNGEQMTFGDGDGQIFQRFTKCPEVIGHEMTHGVTETSSQLAYHGQSGAINEGISDVFGCLVKQFVKGQTAHQADWVIGEGLFQPNINGKGVRDLKNPGSAYNDPTLGVDPCPASMHDYVHTTSDNGGIHINCTIIGHAFYVSAVQMGGNAWEKMGLVWYNTITKRLKAQCTFQQFATMTMKASTSLFGKGSKEHKAVVKGWQEVKVI